MISRKTKIPGTPPKINIEPQNDGLVQMIFLFQGAVFSGSSR